MGGRAPVLALALALPGFLAAAAAAQEGLEAPPRGGALRVEVELFEFGIEPHGLEVSPGKNVTFVLVNTGKIPHNLFVGEEGEVAKWEPTLESGEREELTFEVPETGRIPYWCAVPGHRELGMEGNLTVKGTAPAPGGAERSVVEEVRGLGVNFLAYWVGVVSFVVLIVVIAVTFFILRYGESRHWTDWRERPPRERGAAEEPQKVPLGAWLAFGLVVLVFLVAAVQIVRVV